MLVEGTPMPGPGSCPQSIARLARLQAVELDDRRWLGDLDHLVDEVARVPVERSKAAARPGPTPVVSPTPEPATVLLADPGHAGREHPEPVAAPPPPPPPAQMPGALVWMPLYTFGLGAWVPALWAGLKRPVGDPMRTRFFALSGLIALVAVAGFVMVGSAPEDAEGSATGAWSNVGVALMFVVIIAGFATAMLFRRPPAPRPEPVAESVTDQPVHAREGVAVAEPAPGP